MSYEHLQNFRPLCGKRPSAEGSKCLTSGSSASTAPSYTSSEAWWVVAPGPRLTSSADAASLVFVAANLSLWCAAGRAYGARRLLRRILEHVGEDTIVTGPTSSASTDVHWS